MKVTRTPQHESWLLDQIRASFAAADVERNATLHLSDLAKPRQAYWQRILPISPNDAECLYFLAGRGHEDALGRIAGLEVAAQKTIAFFPRASASSPERQAAFQPDSADVAAIAVSYRPDFSLFDVPAEMKTRRANLAQPGEELVVYENYLTQLRAYCAVEGKTSGILIVFSLLEGRSGDPKNPTHPEIAMYSVEFTEDELAVERKLLGETAVLLRTALDRARASDDPVLSNEHTELPLCQDWLCGKAVKSIRQPAHCDECNKDFSAERYALDHPKTKTGASHHVSAEVADWVYTPRCKWYRLCAPWLVDSQRQAR